MTSATKTKEGRQKVRPGNVFPETVQCFGSEENVLGGRKMFWGTKLEKLNLSKVLLLSCKFAFKVRTHKHRNS